MILRTEKHGRLNEAADMQNAGRSPVLERPRPIAGIGRVLLWSGGSLWIGHSAGRGSPHSHHAIQISLALSGSVKFRSDPDGEWTEYTGVLIRPHHRHQFDGCGESIAQIFVEPETVVGRTLLERHGAGAMNGFPGSVVEALAAPLRAGFASNASNDELIAASKRALALLTGNLPVSSNVDPRITRAIEHVRARMAVPFHWQRPPRLLTCRRADFAISLQSRPAWHFGPTCSGHASKPRWAPP